MQAPWANGAGHAEQRPQRLHHCWWGTQMLPGPQSTWDSRALAPSWVTGWGRLLLPLPCGGTWTCTSLVGWSPHTSCQLITEAPRPVTWLQAGQQQWSQRARPSPQQQEWLFSSQAVGSCRARGWGPGPWPQWQGGHAQPGPTCQPHAPESPRPEIPTWLQGAPPSTSYWAMQPGQTHAQSCLQGTPSKPHRGSKGSSFHPSYRLALLAAAHRLFSLQEPQEPPQPKLWGGHASQNQCQR